MLLQEISDLSDGTYLNLRADKGELFADKGDINLHVVVLCVAVITPDLCDKLFLLHHVFRVGHQYF